MVSSRASTVADYLAELPADRRAEIERVRDVINSALPEGYREGIGYGMIGWVVPLEVYPDTYNKQPLAYAGLAALKNYNSLYLNCVYASKERTDKLKAAFVAAGKKLDMGKSCVRFKRVEDLPLDVIADTVARVDVDSFVGHYEEARGSSRRTRQAP